jgi:TusA-related sulfurtransferase
MKTPKEFVKLLAARDFDRLAGTLAEDAEGRLLLPYGLEEPKGRDAIVAHIKRWFGSASRFELASSNDEAVGGRHRMSWRFTVEREGRREVIEQLVYVDLGPHGIRKIDLLCSGFQQEASNAVRQFDAGAMGCADGLAQEFRNQISEVPLGAILEVVVRDPAAKEDLPSLARLLGHQVRSIDSMADGRQIITVERKK